METYNNQTTPDANNHKKTLLRHLIGVAVGGAAGRGLHEMISGIKAAMGAYKNYSKEWDNLHGLGKANGSGGPGMQQQQRMWGVKNGQVTMNPAGRPMPAQSQANFPNIPTQNRNQLQLNQPIIKPNVPSV